MDFLALVFKKREADPRLVRLLKQKGKKISKNRRVGVGGRKRELYSKDSEQTATMLTLKQEWTREADLLPFAKKCLSLI